MISVRSIHWPDILPVWRDKLWPGRSTPIKPMSSMTFEGGYDMTIYDRFMPHFVGAYLDGVLVGVNSCHQTAQEHMRSRGLYVDEAHRGQGIAGRLLERTAEIARDAGCALVWTLPRKATLGVYERAGFVQTSDWFDEGVEFGPNCYAVLRIES